MLNQQLLLLCIIYSCYCNEMYCTYQENNTKILTNVTSSYVCTEQKNPCYINKSLVNTTTIALQVTHMLQYVQIYAYSFTTT